MERRSFVQGAGLAGVLAAGAAPAIVHAQANIRWRLTSAFPKALDTIYGAAEVFSKAVSDMSGGKFQISVHPSGELVGGFGQVDALLVEGGDLRCDAVENLAAIGHYLFNLSMKARLLPPWLALWQANKASIGQHLGQNALFAARRVAPRSAIPASNGLKDQRKLSA